MARLGFDYAALRALRDDVIYVSNCGFGHSGPYASFKTWGPIVQAVCGLTFTSGLPDQPPAGWGYSYMDHTGGYYMAIAILLALVHRERTGEGQWVDLATTEAGATLLGPAILDYTVNGRPSRRPGQPHSNRSDTPPMAPHGIFPAQGEDAWIAIACRDDAEWSALARVVAADGNRPREGDRQAPSARSEAQPSEGRSPRPPAGVHASDWTRDPRFERLSGRLAHQDELERKLSEWTRARPARETAAALVRERIPATPVQRPGERIDEDPSTAARGLWPTVKHTAIGEVRVDGLPVHFSDTDWEISRGGPCLGEHNEHVYGDLLGLSPGEIAELRREGVI
jgi:crotonobetainyl-CoA:carnitine CoA-transferase CaiB-like acyl-CoA transferase